KLLRSSNNFNAVNQNSPRDWELELASGLYVIEIAVGDPEAINSQHTVRAEGVTLVDNFVPTSDAKQRIGRDTIRVTGGKLTLDDEGAPANGNTKIVYVEVMPVDSSAFLPIVSAELSGNQQPDGDYLNQVEIAIAAMEKAGSSGIASLEYSFDGTTYQDYTEEVLVVAPLGSGRTAYTLYVRATDGFGNVGTLQTDFAVAEPVGGVIRLENMTKLVGRTEGFPADDFLSFSAIGRPNNSVGDTVLTYDVNVLRIHNEGSGPLVIYELTTTDTNHFVFEIDPISPAGLMIDPGTFIDAPIRFKNIGGDRRIVTDEVVMVSNADNALEVSATLRGGFAARVEGRNELNSQQVFETLGFSTEMGREPNGDIIVYPNSDYPTDAEVDAGDQGDLILSEYFVRADPNQPVRMHQLAALHGPGSATSRLVKQSGGDTRIRFSHQILKIKRFQLLQTLSLALRIISHPQEIQITHPR
ncbi:MAG: hypothetical protein AAGA62_14195, partial [Bacteroidota bacterium]